VSLVVLLDAGPLGLLAYSRALPAATRCRQWLSSLGASGTRVIVPEITDFEVRRELLRAGLMRGIIRLDALKAGAEYAPLTTETMMRTAEFWADARRQGRPTAGPHELDCDVTLAAQATLVARPGEHVVVATTNVGHLARFVDARDWRNIP